MLHVVLLQVPPTWFSPVPATSPIVDSGWVRQVELQVARANKMRYLDVDGSDMLSRADFMAFPILELYQRAHLQPHAMDGTTPLSLGASLAQGIPEQDTQKMSMQTAGGLLHRDTSTHLRASTVLAGPHYPSLTQQTA